MIPSPLGIIRDIAGPAAGQRIVDVGCGEGGLVAALAAALGVLAKLLEQLQHQVSLVVLKVLLVLALAHFSALVGRWPVVQLVPKLACYGSQLGLRLNMQLK